MRPSTRAKLSCPILLAGLVILGSVSVALAHPGSAIAVGRDGRVFFVDTGRGIFVVEPGGSVKRHEGPAFHWFAMDLSSRFKKTRWPSIPSSEIRSVGLNPTLVLSSDFPITIGGDGALYCPEHQPDRSWRMIRLSPSGARSIHARMPAETRSDGAVRWINGLAAGPDSSLYYTHDRAVRKIDKRGVVSTVAANVTVQSCVSIPGIGPELRPYLRGLEVAPDGTVFVAAAGCGAVLKITSTGQVTPILRTVSPYAPTAVALSGGEVYVLEYLHTASDNRQEWPARVRKITRTGKVVTLADMKR